LSRSNYSSQVSEKKDKNSPPRYVSKKDDKGINRCS
jgi:hypothetical protein